MESSILQMQYYKQANNVRTQNNFFFVLKLFEKSKVIYAELWWNADFDPVKQNFEYSLHHHFGLGAYTNN